ncbi:3-hydroxyacyl-[acyl-carrier-protein] dehydratase, mitochondrial [Setaria viridis]|uniref:MaoC-like domain-containing protein n=1 Tax=Setaria viridis TaxID=4556 RepID=A0A4U6TMS1_SETVI|nr:(R)-specific enoyl-CoA hydratase-like [Setaria viridis]TKW03132.1 hypothetical protein SEVIR_7G003000v2 [Setaria viridis]
MKCSNWVSNIKISHESTAQELSATPPVSFLVRSSSDSTELPICAAAMRLGRRAIFPLVRTISTTSAAPPPPAVLSVGHALRERRCFTEADVAAYAAVSGDRNPVHLDDAVARELCGFQRGRVVHGMLVASLFPSIIAASFPGAVYASQTLKFAAPVYVGDEVVARVQALHIKAMTTANSSTANRYVVKFATKCFTDEEGGSLAIEGEAMAVVPTLELSS